MALPSSGALALSDIQTEFGGSNPIGLSEYYGVATGVPASGTIDISDFYGTSASSASGTTITCREDQVTNDSKTARRVGFQASNGGDFVHPESTLTGGFNSAFGSISSSSIITGGNITGFTIANYTGSSVGNRIIIVISTDRTTDGGWTSVAITSNHPPFYGTNTMTLNRTSANGFNKHSRLEDLNSTVRYKWYYDYPATTYTSQYAQWSGWLYQATNNGSVTVSFT